MAVPESKTLPVTDLPPRAAIYNQYSDRLSNLLLSCGSNRYTFPEQADSQAFAWSTLDCIVTRCCASGLSSKNTLFDSLLCSGLSEFLCEVVGDSRVDYVEEKDSLLLQMKSYSSLVSPLPS